MPKITTVTVATISDSTTFAAFNRTSRSCAQSDSTEIRMTPSAPPK